jgi:O-succinylbenzoic acid--CoA ligase
VPTPRVFAPTIAYHTGVSGSGEIALVAVCLPPSQAAGVIHQAWDQGEAVLAIDPAAPSAELTRLLQLARPTHLVDRAGRRSLAGGRQVPASDAAVVATSGTTGEPKLVELTRSGMEASARAVSSALQATTDDTWLCCLPVHFVAGLAILARCWVTGQRLVVHDGFSPEALAASTGDRATLVSVVPTMLGRLLDGPGVPSWFRHVLVGGGPLPEALRQRAADADVDLALTYGMTETWGGVLHDGHPLEGVDVRLDEDDTVLLRGPMTMAGYLDRPELTEAVLSKNGWLRTGDVGAWGTDGRLVIVDRRSDLINTGGVKVSPTEVEAVLGTHPKLEDVCIAGEPDEEWGQRVVAYVVVTPGQSAPSVEELREWCASKLSRTKLPRKMVIVDQVPRSGGGKALRRLLPS